MATPQEKTTPPQILITKKEDDGKSWYIQVPRFWIDDLFSSKTQYAKIKNADGRNRSCNRIPASFWKYTFYLWRWVSVPREIDGRWQYTTKIPMDNFPVRTPAAVQWTAAYAVSGVIRVKAGYWTEEHDKPTEFTYEPNTSHTAWKAYITALNYALNIRPTKDKDGDAYGQNTGAWKVLVAREVDRCRKDRGLPPVNENWLKVALAGGADRREIAELVNGVIEPVWHSARRLQKTDETDDDYERRLMLEGAYTADRREHGGF